MTADTGENGAPSLLTFFNKEGKRSRVKRSPDEMSRASRGADTCVSGLTMGQQSYAADLMNQKTTRDDQRKEEAMEDAFEILKRKEIEQGLSKEESQQLFVQIFQQILEERKSKYEEEDHIQDQRFKDAFDSLVEERTQKKPPSKSLFRGGASSSSPESPSASSTTDHFCKPMLSPSPQRRSSPSKVIHAPEAPNSPASIGTADIFAAFTLPIANPPLETDNKNASSANKEEKKVRRGKKQKPTTKVVRRVRRIKLKKNTEDTMTEGRDEVEEKKSHPVQQKEKSAPMMKVEPSRTISSDTLDAVKNYSSKQLVLDGGLQTQKTTTDDPNLSKSKMSKNNGPAMRNPKKELITKKKTKIQTKKEDVRKVMERIMSSETLPTAPLSASLSTAGEEEEEEPSRIEKKPSKNDTTAKKKKKKSRTHNKEGKSRSKTKESSSKIKSKGGANDKQSTTTRKTPASIPTDPQNHQDETNIREGKRATEKPKRRKTSSSKDRTSSTKDSSDASSKIRKKRSSSSSTKKTKEMDATEESKKSKRRSSSGKKSSTHQRRSKDEIH